MPRYVLLYHECPPNFERLSHWDLMLESGDVLRTWALAQLPRDWQAAHVQSTAADPRCPPLAASNSVPAEQLGDHRLAYLDYEGPLSNDRGRVTRVAAGTYESRAQLPESWQITLAGGLAGKIALRQSASEGPTWTLTYQQDS